MIATIDVGTNTAHLLLAYALPDGSIAPIRSETRYVRLGQGVDASGEIHPDALERLSTTLIHFGELARAAGADPIRTVGTSASRDVSDRSGLVEFVRVHAGLDYEIIPGEEEALLTSLGAVTRLDLDPQSNTVVVDIGGGSTELTYTRRDNGTLSIEALTSLNVGSVRLTERCFERLPPTPAEITQAERLTRESLGGARRPADGRWTMIGAAGTIRALALLAAGSGSDRGAAILSGGMIRDWRERLLTLDFEETLALNPDVLGGRADVIAAGVLILDIVMDYLDADRCLVSPWGLRHGMAIRCSRRLAGLE